MTSKNKTGLKRGLDALMGSSHVDVGSGDQLRQIPIQKIQTGRYQARVQMQDEALHELAEAIKATNSSRVSGVGARHNWPD